MDSTSWRVVVMLIGQIDGGGFSPVGISGH